MDGAHGGPGRHFPQVSHLLTLLLSLTGIKLMGHLATMSTHLEYSVYMSRFMWNDTNAISVLILVLYILMF